MNYIDNYQRSGLYPNKSGFPLTLGQEAAGTILALPEPQPADEAFKARGFAIGKRAVAVRTPFFKLFLSC